MTKKESTGKSSRENSPMKNKRASIKQEKDRVVISMSRDEAIDLLHTLRNVDHFKNSSFFGSEFALLLRRFFVDNEDVESNTYDFLYDRHDD